MLDTSRLWVAPGGFALLPDASLEDVVWAAVSSEPDAGRESSSLVDRVASGG